MTYERRNRGTCSVLTKVELNNDHTIENVGNAETAAKRLLELITDLSAKGESNRFLSGPCSKAVIIKDGWYR